MNRIRKCTHTDCVSGYPVEGEKSMHTAIYHSIFLNLCLPIGDTGYFGTMLDSWVKHKNKNMQNAFCGSKLTFWVETFFWKSMNSATTIVGVTAILAIW